MNPARLFALLAEPAWTRDTAPVDFSDAAYEYLLRFCEVNRNDLIKRIEKERCAQSTNLLIQRFSQLLLSKWEKERDYRFLNLLYKFRAKHYLDHFPKDSASATLRDRLDDILRRELHHD